jgi:hypothetical protein
MHVRLSMTARKLRAIFERLPGISSPGMLSTTENACLGDASIGVARNPLRDGAPPTGHSADASDVSSVRPSQRSTKPLAALHRSSGQRRSTWVTTCAALLSGGLRRGSHAVTGSGIRQNDAVHSSKTVGSKTTVSPRAVFRDDPDAFLPSKIDPRGLYRPCASSADFRQAEVEKSISLDAPSASAVMLVFSLTSCHPPTRDHVETIRGPGSAKVKTRWPNGNARTLPLVDRTRSDFRNRKLQETRPRCRLIERRVESRATRMITLGPRLFSCRPGWRLTPLAQGMHVDSSLSQAQAFRLVGPGVAALRQSSHEIPFIRFSSASRSLRRFSMISLWETLGTTCGLTGSILTNLLTG